MPLTALSEFDGLDDAARLAQAVLGLMPDAAVMVLDRELRIVLMEGEIYAGHGHELKPFIGRDVRDARCRGKRPTAPAPRSRCAPGPLTLSPRPHRA